MLALEASATTALWWFLAAVVMVVFVIGIGLVFAVKAGEVSRDDHRPGEDRHDDPAAGSGSAPRTDATSDARP